MHLLLHLISKVTKRGIYIGMCLPLLLLMLIISSMCHIMSNINTNTSGVDVYVAHNDGGNYLDDLLFIDHS